MDTNHKARRFFHVVLWIFVFEVTTILMSGGHILPTKAKACNPLKLSTCEPW